MLVRLKMKIVEYIYKTIKERILNFRLETHKSELLINNQKQQIVFSHQYKERVKIVKEFLSVYNKFEELFNDLRPVKDEKDPLIVHKALEEPKIILNELRHIVNNNRIFFPERLLNKIDDLLKISGEGLGHFASLNKSNKADNQIRIKQQGIFLSYYPIIEKLKKEIEKQFRALIKIE